MRRRFEWIIPAALAAAIFGAAIFGRSQAPAGAAATVPGTTAKQAIEAAAKALGGIDKIRNLKNMTLIGYAQYAYQNGGGNISALPGAPQKYIAANDYRRIYDLERGRKYFQERRNDLFPFANDAGHDFALQRQILDGNIAYNINAQNQAVRGGDVRDRRMWMLTNPVTAIRAALDPANTVSNRRQESGLTLVDTKLKEGDLMTIAIRPSMNLPEFVRWVAPQINLGEYTLTTRFYGYEDFDGVQLPMGYTTTSDWRNVDQVKIYVDDYLVDTAIQDLAAPQSVKNVPPAAGPEGPAIQVTPIARGVWRITPGAAMVIEFADHMTLYENER